MGAIFSKPKAPAPPKLPPAPALPSVDPIVEDDTMARARRRSGFRKTILTGDVTPGSGKKKLLGG